MASIAFKLFDQVVSQLDQNRLFVEIGSDRGSGSTQYLANLARITHNDFISVDVDPVFCGPAVQTAHMSGETFVAEKLPTMNKNICLVYLDSVDWIKQPMTLRKGQGSVDEYNLINQYSFRQGMELNNVNSSLSHLKQIAGMLPFMDDQCVVIFEQTWFHAAFDTFLGKGGPAVYLLMAEGFNLLSATWKEQYVMMGRGISAPGLPNLNIDRLNKRQANPAARGDVVLYDNVV